MLSIVFCENYCALLEVALEANEVSTYPVSEI